MLASAAYFVVKVMVKPADETHATTASRVPARPARDQAAPYGTRAHGDAPSGWRRLFASARRSTDGAGGSVARRRRTVGREVPTD